MRVPAAAVHLAGYALIAAALYFGLRGRPAPPPAAPPPPVEAVAPAPPPGPVDGARFEPEVRDALERQRPALLRCLSAGARGQVTFRLLFGADGRELARGFHTEGQLEPAECLQPPRLERLHIAPPGAPTSVIARLSLP